MTIEDGWMLAEHVRRDHHRDGSVDWLPLAAYDAVRPEHCRRVVTTSRAWGELWHLDARPRAQRNVLLRACDTYDTRSSTGSTAPPPCSPTDEPPMFETIALDSVDPATADPGPHLGIQHPAW
ncbi:hypothetical protein [Nocardia niwae]|uniref:FAD-binding domain-containing protein n=1 Tax=Nocardia niwae TaxID=626084 RepID=A0ABV2XKM9_9NOCA